MRVVLGSMGFVFALVCAPAWAQQCDFDFVSVKNQAVEVLPTGTDDTANLQCAFDQAIREGFATVQLRPAEYSISHIRADSFEGAFQGRSRTTTTVNILDGSFDCSPESMDTPAAFEFVGGSPVMRYIRVVANQPCKQVQTESLPSLISFPVRRTENGYEQTTVRATLDRVDLESAGPYFDLGHTRTAVSAGCATCPSPLLGTLTVNRSSINGFAVGVETSMRGGARVDIRLNKFENVATGVQVVDAFQDTSIGYNTFDLQFPLFGDFGDLVIDYFSADSAVVTLYSGQFTPPPGNRVLIYNNTMNLNGGRAYLSEFFTENIWQLDLRLTGNTLNVDDFTAIAIDVSEVDGGVISNNTFQGEADYAALVINPSSARNVFDWTIVNNDFREFESNEGDIILESNVLRSFVGRNLGASIVNRGSSNAIYDELFQ